MISPRLIFAYMDVSGYRGFDGITLNQKIPYESTSLSDDVHGRTNAA